MHVKEGSLLLKFHSNVFNTSIACETKETASCIFKKEDYTADEMENEECNLCLSYQKVALLSLPPNGRKPKPGF